ncbi:hypothetical protein [Brevundimonas lenta]|uniref:Uncharacterized protein n=1 Tax=Brevundimonas lenta TaxID=424796 RepID=A0A7W6JCQ2_9CAUL|nr:hypothetical protein [Brevundimonas lenta]MBB4082631.1 hypothetical protein [Brevundimonas lenta]
MADEQKSVWRIAGETLPLVSLGGVALAMSYTVGYFTPFGTSWLSFLTVADFLSGIWFLTPTLLAALIGGFLFHATGRPGPSGNTTPVKAITVIVLVKNLIIGILAVVGFSAVMLVRAIYPEDFRLLAGLTIMHGFGVFFLPELYWNHARARTIIPLCFTYGAITVVLGFGMMMGESMKRAPPSTYVSLTNGGSLCTTLVGQFGGGLLTYNPKTRTPTFVSRDRVVAIAKLEKCQAS